MLFIFTFYPDEIIFLAFNNKNSMKKIDFDGYPQ